MNIRPFTQAVYRFAGAVGASAQARGSEFLYNLSTTLGKIGVSLSRSALEGAQKHGTVETTKNELKAVSTELSAELSASLQAHVVVPLSKTAEEALDVTVETMEEASRRIDYDASMQVVGSVIETGQRIREGLKSAPKTLLDGTERLGKKALDAATQVMEQSANRVNPESMMKVVASGIKTAEAAGRNMKYAPGMLFGLGILAVLGNESRKESKTQEKIKTGTTPETKPTKTEEALKSRVAEIAAQMKYTVAEKNPTLAAHEEKQQKASSTFRKKQEEAMNAVREKERAEKLQKEQEAVSVEAVSQEPVEQVHPSETPVLEKTEEPKQEPKASSEGFLSKATLEKVAKASSVILIAAALFLNARSS